MRHTEPTSATTTPMASRQNVTHFLTETQVKSRDVVYDVVV